MAGNGHSCQLRPGEFLGEEGAGGKFVSIHAGDSELRSFVNTIATSVVDVKGVEVRVVQRRVGCLRIVKRLTSFVREAMFDMSATSYVNLADSIAKLFPPGFGRASVQRNRLLHQVQSGTDVSYS